MKMNLTRLFSLSVVDNEYFEDKKDKIEFVGCRLTHQSCVNFLPAINDYFRESEKFYRDKNYNQAIDALERAYYKAGELQETDCLRCALFFQSTILQSLDSIHRDLEKMSKGLFGTSRYQVCYMKAADLLNRLKSTREVKPVYPLTATSKTLLPAYY